MALVLALLAAVPAAAQSSSVVIPDGLAGVEGSTFDWATARYLPARSQMVYDASRLTGLGTVAITKVGVRANFTSTSTYPAHDVMTTLRIGFSRSITPSTVNQQSFRANHPATFVTVLNNVKVAYPMVSGATPRPRGYVSIPLATPAPYVSGTSLIMQWDVASVSGGTETWLWYNDAQFYSTSTRAGTYSSTGSTCPVGRPGKGYATKPGEELSWYFYSGAGNNLPAFGMIGASKTTWLGQTLPLDLGPFNAPGCSIYCSQDFAVIGNTDPNGTLGRVRFDLPIPGDPGLSRNLVYTQTFVLDPAAGNGLGLRASALNQFTLGDFGGGLPAIVLIDYARTISDSPRVTYNDGVVFSIN